MSKFNAFKLPNLKFNRNSNRFFETLASQKSTPKKPQAQDAIEDISNDLFREQKLTLSSRSEIEKYYQRGINLMKPEIIMTSEYVPIIKSHDEAAPLQIQAGSEKLDVNQIFKLIELHTAVQESLNLLSDNFVNETAEISVNFIYEAAKQYFDNSHYKETFSKTLQNFAEELENILVFNTQNSLNEDDADSASAYISFRSLLVSGSKIQKDSINRILEMIIVEDLTTSLMLYFRKIIHLKEVTIPQYLDIKQIRSGLINSGINANFMNTSKANIEKLKNHYHDTDSSHGYVIQASKNAFSFLSQEEISQKTLGYKSILNKAKNYEIIYATLINIFKTINFKNLSFYHDEMFESIYEPRLSEKIFNSSNSHDIKMTLKLEQFVNHINVSSFLIGNVGNTNARFTSYALNKKTSSRNLNHQAPGSLTINENSSQTIEDYLLVNSARPGFLANSQDASNGSLPFISAYLDHDSNHFVSELMTASIFDIVYSNNQRLVNTDSFLKNFTSLVRYEKNILGKSFGLSIPPIASEAGLGASVDSVEIDENITYDNPESHVIKNTLGEVGNAILKTKKILNEQVSILPGLNKGYKSLFKTLTGDAGIPAEAFDDFSIDSLKAYNRDLEVFLNKNLKDIDSLFGIVTPHAQNTSKLSVTKVFDDITNEFSKKLQLLIGQISPGTNDAVYTDNYFKEALSLFVMICAGQDNNILSKTFASFLLRDESKGGFFNYSDNRFFPEFLKDASSKSLQDIMSLLGKSLQSPESLTEGNGQYKDYLADFTSSYTFINNSKFDGSYHFLGKQLQESDLRSSDKIGFKSKNTKSELQKDFRDVLRYQDSNFCAEAINHVNDLCSKVEGYEAKNISSFYDSLETDITGERVQEQIDQGDGSSSDQGLNSLDENLVLYYLKQQYETPNKFDIDSSLLGTSQVHREFSIFAFLCRLASKMLTVKITFNKEQKSFYITYSKTELLAFYDCLTKQSRSPSFVAPYRTISWDDYRIAKQEASDVYRVMTKPFYERVNKVKRSYGLLYGHANNLFELEDKIQSVISTEVLSNKEKIALDYFGLRSRNKQAKANNDRARDSLRIFSNENQGGFTSAAKKSFISFLNSNSYPTLFQNYINNIISSKNSLLFSPNESITNRQIYQMTLALSPKNYGMTSKEKLGKKTIISIGLPPKLVTKLGAQAQSKNGDNDYFNSPYICVHVFKKDAIGGNIMYYPKPFIFNTRLESFENFNLSSLSQPNHETNPDSINSFDKLLSEFSLYKHNVDQLLISSNTGMTHAKNFNDLLIESNDLSYINNASTGNRLDVLKEMKTNHMISYYLNLYKKLTTGLDISENVFPMYSYNQKSNEVDESVLDLYEKYRNNLFLKYPSINVDPILAREFIRLERHIGSSRFFSLEQRTKNIFTAKAFERIFNVFVNEADFVAYPYVDNSFLSNDVLGGNAFVDSLESLYGEDTCPFFVLDGKQQIQGTNAFTKNSLIMSTASNSNPNQFENLSFQDLTNTIFGKQKQFYKHMNEIESENVADVYEFFTVISVIRRK